MRTINGRVLLRHNRELSQSEFIVAREICDRINQLVNTRDLYIAENHLDAQFCLPSGLWSPTAHNDYLNTFAEVSSCSFDVINRLRLFVSFFSGYSLRRASSVPGPPSFEKISSSLDMEIDKLLKLPDEWVSRWISLTARIPTDVIFSPPRFLGEIGWDVSGVIVNHDTCVYQERINLLYEAGVFDWLNKRLSSRGRLRVLEIGAGYGALAYKIKGLFPAADYWICDLPEALLFSVLYLSLSRPDCKAAIGEEAPYGFTFIPNYQIEKISGKFDLVINTLSFSEMSEHQLRMYAQKVSELIDDGFVFEQNQDNRHMGLPCVGDILHQYFAYSRPLVSMVPWPVTQGIASLWANRPVSLPGIGMPKESHLWNALVRYRPLLSRLWRVSHKGITRCVKKIPEGSK